MTIQNIGIVGYGSIGQKHHQILASLSDDFQFSILTQQKGIQNSFNSLESFVKVDLDYIIISNPTSLHYESLQFLDAQYKKIKFLIEKPLFIIPNLLIVNLIFILLATTLDFTK